MIADLNILNIFDAETFPDRSNRSGRIPAFVTSHFALTKLTTNIFCQFS